MSNRKISQLDAAESTDLSNDSSLLHLVNPNRVSASERNRKMTRTQLADFIPNDAISSGKIAAGAVTDVKLAANAVTTAKINDLAVTSDKIANLGVTTAKVNNAAVTTDKLANLSVTTDKLVDLNVTTGKLANNAVDNTKLRDSAGLSVVGRSANTTGDPADIVAATDAHVLRRSGSAIGFGQVASGGIADSAVVEAKIDSNAVTNVKLRDSAGLSVIGRSASTTGDPADIVAGTDGHVLRRAGSAVGFGQVVAAGIANNAVTEAKIAAGFGLIPQGGIIMWSGAIANIPTGWALCDGTNGTPDLRNRFVVGAGQTYAVAATGGEATVTLTSSQIPAHQHAYSGTTSAGTGTTAPHTQASSFGGGGGYIVGVPVSAASFSPGDHTHAFSGTTDNNVGGGGSHTNLPPYYALAYIMKL